MGTVGHLDRHRLAQVFGERIRFAEPLSRHTSFRIGGPADVWVEVADAAEIRRVQACAAATDLPLLVLGGGTNVLVSDRGVRGIVMHLSRALASVEWRANGGSSRVRTGAALPLKQLVSAAIARDLTGLEFAEGIPGTVGGGLLMNAGAFGGEVAAIVECVEGVNGCGQLERLPRGDLRFGYRRLDLPRGFVVTHLELQLRAGERAAIAARRGSAKRGRLAHQPLGYPNAGSIFKNPPGEFAGRLIEAAGMKGQRRGGAMVSRQHANFIVNVGSATAAEVRELMTTVAHRVWELKGIRLQPEIKLVGDWSRP
ncbi:MAG: UDP-N-acetylmuramate dehydrogenase [Candidatus Binatia bacterium]